MNFLRLSTAISFTVGPFVLASDGDTQYASTFAATDVHLFKHNGGVGSMAQKDDATAPTMETKGFARVTLDATDTNTVGNLLVALHKATTLVAFRWFSVLPAAVYDALFAETGAGIRSAPQSLPTGVIAAATFAAGAIDASAIAADAIGSSELAASAVTEIVNGVWDEPASGHVTAGTMASVARIIFSGACLAGSTATVVKLDSTASTVTGAYAGRVAMLLHGNGEGQAMPISSYDGPTKSLTLAHALDFTPDATTYIAIG